jgi:hypothetical protein
MRFKKLSCFVAGLGMGIFITIVTLKWDMFPLPYALVFVILLTGCFCLSWILTFNNTNQSNEKYNPTSKSPKHVIMKGSIKSTKSPNNS